MVRCVPQLGIIGLCVGSVALVATQVRGGVAAPQSWAVVGRVVELENSGTRRALGGAIVTLVRRASPDESAQSRENRRSIQSDNLGRFDFDGLPPGQYDLQASLNGYAGGGYGQSGPLLDGGTAFLSGVLRVGPDNRARDIELVLWKYGTLTGAILDETNEPVIGAVVRVMPVTDGDARRSLGGGRTTTSDDRGRYQFSLPPGSYLVAVEGSLITMPAAAVEQGPPGARSGGDASRQSGSERLANGVPYIGRGTVTRLGNLVVSGGTSLPPRLTSDGRVLSYPTTFYGGTTDSASAQLVQVGSGEDRGAVDVQVIPRPTSRVSGTVRDPQGRPLPGVGIRLVSGAWSDASSSLDLNGVQGMTDSEGRFAVYGVVAGTYLVRVLKLPANLLESIEVFLVNQNRGAVNPKLMIHPPVDQPTYWSAQPLGVGDTDVRDAEVVLQEGVRATGRLVSPDAPFAAEVLSRVAVTFTPQPDAIPALFQVRQLGRFVEADRFATPQLVPGPYFISVSGLPPGWALRSVLVPGAADDAADVAATLAGSDVSGVVVTVTNRTTRLHGEVHSRDGKPIPGVAVVAFPTEDALWKYPTLSRRIRVFRTDDGGEFETSSLPQGSYYLATVTQPLGQAISVGLLQRLRFNAVSAALVEGSETTVRLIGTR